MQYLTDSDYSCITSEPQEKINMIMAGMTSLMDDTNQKVSLLEGQPWFERMCNTITGKNKMTLDEIAANRDKVNGYLSEAISALYDQNMIDHNIMLGLGNKINSLYASQVELKQMLGAFVNKLNQKIISIDNFHMLTEEINQHVYTSENRMASICMIVSQLDGRTVNDQRKMDILMRAMEQNGIIVDEEQSFVDFLTDLLSINDSDAGVVAMMLDNSKDEYIVEIANDVIREYYFLPEKVRKMKNRKGIVETILNQKQIDLSYTIASSEIYKTLVSTIANHIVKSEQAEIEDEFRKKYEILIKYFDDSKTLAHGISKLFEYLNMSTKVIYTRQQSYIAFLDSIKASCCPGSLYRKKTKEAIYAIETFWQCLYEKYSDLYQRDDCMNRTGAAVWDNNVQITKAIFDDNFNIEEKKLQLAEGIDEYLQAAYDLCIQINEKLFGLGLNAVSAECSLDDFDSIWSMFKGNDVFGSAWVLQFFEKNLDYYCQRVITMIGSDYGNYSYIYDLQQRYCFDQDYDYFQPAVSEYPKITFISDGKEEDYGITLSVKNEENIVRVKVRLSTNGPEYTQINAYPPSNKYIFKWDNDCRAYKLEDSTCIIESTYIVEKNGDQSWDDITEVSFSDANNSALSGKIEIYRYKDYNTACAELDSMFAEFDNMFADINNAANSILGSDM